METKKILPVALLVICLSSFLIATHVVTIDTSIIPEDISSIVRIVVNNTDTTEAANISVVNISLPSNFIFSANTNSTTGGTHTFTNTSSVLTWANDGLVMNITNQSFVFNVTMATAGVYNITVYTWNSTDLSTSYKEITINDTTFPSVSALNLPVTSGNYSGSIILNATIVDDTESLVYFNITNSSGGQNGTFTASGSGNSWNATMNTSNFADGLYNISVWVNDSNNQINNTVIATTVRIDNTAPTNTYFYCTPDSVYVDETVTCSCTGAADSGSGLASTVFTTNPSTSSTGTFTETCTMTDRAGNTYAPTATYTVTASPSGSSFASGGSSSSSSSVQTWSMTYTSTEDQLKAGYTRKLSANERVKVRVINEEHFVGIKSVTETSAVIEIASDPIEITLDVGEDAKADVNEDGVYDIYVKLNSITDGKADITITKIEQEIQEGEKAIETTGEIIPPETETPEDSSKMDSKWYWIIGAVVVIIILIGLGLRLNKPKTKKK